MSYERLPVAESTAAIPAQPTPEMRPEKVFMPYQARPTRPQKAADTTAVGQSNNNERVPAEPGKAAETVTLSPQMAALARKEQKARQFEQQLKQKEADLAKQLAEVEELKGLKSKLAAKDYSGLDNLVSYDEYTQYLLNKGTELTPEQKRLQEISQKLETVEKTFQDDIEKRFEAAKQERRTAIKALAEKPEFHGIKKLQVEEHVLQHILDTWEHESIEITPEQAAKEVLDVLQEKAKAYNAAFHVEQAPTGAEDKKELPPLKPAVKTLTNQMTTGEIKRPPRPYSGMSDAERWAEARRRVEERMKGKS
jgi:nitrous oxide reductase